ncbi:MAG: biotin/lipoate A/B protein ligase family protein [Candidatus Bathyarchaeum tardum]|nr:MAG: biotin/lipoate A/B protein ligase family protein [Candidatus Bathyarchaeum tardum]
MSDRWRLLKLETADAYTNMAIDEAILTARIHGKVTNTLRFYMWEPSAVSIGRFQTLENEINLGECKKQQIDIVRRISGGGAVYHDKNGEITYSITAKTADLGCKNLDLLGAYQKICTGLNEAAKILGAKADYHSPDQKRCPNLSIDGKKISGNAQTSKKGVLMQHGTFLLQIDYPTMFSILRVPWSTNLEEIIDVAKRKLGCIKQEINPDFSVQDAYNALVRGFEKALNVEFVEEPLTVYEQKLAEKLKKEKFVTEDWNFLGKSSF